MLQKNKTESHLPQSAHERIQQIIANQFQTPVFVSMLLCFTLSLVLGFFSTLEENPIDRLLNFLYQIPFINQDFLQPLKSVYNAIWGIQIVLLLCGAVTVAGFWIILWCAKTNAGARVYNIGFTAVEIVKFNQLVVSLFAIPWLATQAYRLLSKVKTYIDGFVAQNIASRISILQAIVVVIAFGTIVYLFNTLLTFMLLKDSACTVCVNSRISIYSPVYCFVLSAIMLYAQFKIGFSIQILLSCAAMILFGIFIIQYRNEMNRSE